jgi:hypothetical protein
LTTSGPGKFQNPYYGTDVPTNATVHVSFRLPFRLFGYLDTLLGSHLWLTLFVWNLFWWGLLCWIAVWLFRKFLPDNSTLLVALGLALLMWFNFEVFKSLIVAWFHLPSLHGFENLGLAYIRSFFPQLPVPLLLGYLGLQMSVLRAQRVHTWVAMGVLQFSALAIFPYATLMMAGISFVIIVWLVVARIQSAPWRGLLAYGTLCALVDLLYLRLSALPHQPQAQVSIFSIELAEVPHLIGGMWILLAFLTLATALASALEAEIKWSLVGIGLTNLTLMLGDVCFSETSLMLSHHAGYFVHSTAAVLLTFLLSALSVRLRARARYLRFGLTVIVVFCALNAMLIAQSTYRTSLPINQQQAKTTALLKATGVSADDLLIVRAKNVDDPCEWAPLLSNAKVLFCRNASALLTPNQNLTIQRFRQALYLYFIGEDSGQLQRMTADPGAMDEQMRLAYMGGILPSRKADRAQGLSAIRTDLIPLLDAASRKDPAMGAFLRQFSRILVVDNLHDPVFDRQRLASYLVIQKEVPSGNRIVLYCKPK